MSELKGKFIELPIRIAVKNDDGSMEEVVRNGALCFDPPVEIVPHPKLVGITMINTAFGTKAVQESYDRVMEKLRRAKD